MTSTTYYNLNIVEGTDIVNPLVVDNPNYQKIDETMHNNAVAGVTLATEIANATVHAITRENSECAVIRFIATSNWKAGDTATVDGVPVTTLLPSGETLPDGAYVINANVLCILTGTNLTIYAERKKAENANEIAFNDTTVGAELVKLDREIVNLDGEIVRLDGEIDNVNNNLNKQWIKIADANINGTVSFPIDWKEILVTGRRISDNQYFCTINVPVILVENRNITVQFGAGRGNSGYDIKYQTLMSKTGAQNITVFMNAQEMKDGFAFEFYYK